MLGINSRGRKDRSPMAWHGRKKIPRRSSPLQHFLQADIHMVPAMYLECPASACGEQQILESHTSSRRPCLHQSVMADLQLLCPAGRPDTRKRHVSNVLRLDFPASSVSPGCLQHCISTSKFRPPRSNTYSTALLHQDGFRQLHVWCDQV
jgi:hypothetical protein